MAINDHKPRVIKYRAVITTVDTSQRIIEARTADKQIHQISIFDIPSAFTWPQENEVWNIHQENNYWKLGNKVVGDDDFQIEDLSPGDTLINGNNVYTNESKLLITQIEKMLFLPDIPIDLQEIYFIADSSKGVLWHLSYSLENNRWEFIGGSTLGEGPSGDLFTTTSSKLINGPSFIIPLSGTYEVWGTCSVQQQNTGIAQENVNIIANNVNTGISGFFVGQDTYDGATISFSGIVNLIQGQTLSLQCQNNNTINARYSRGSLFIRPIILDN